MYLDKPWLKFYENMPHTLEYPDCSMAKLVLDSASKYPDNYAYDFFGCKQDYRTFADQVKKCAQGLKSIGIEKGERFTICMPNTPQAVTMFYALNLIGAVANMVHPLSAEEELVNFISNSNSVAVLTLDQFASKLEKVMPRTNARILVLTGIDDGMSGIVKSLYRLTKGRKLDRKPTGGNILRYTDLLKLSEGYAGEYDAGTGGEELAAILYSGGTSGTSKGIMLTNLNFNALAMQTLVSADCIVPAHKMLAILPIFHGFGMGVCVHTVFIMGATSILVPQFSQKTYINILKKQKPHYIVGVPTLYEALLRSEEVAKIDMSQLEGIFCGGDTLTVELKRKVDALLKERGSNEQIREGYGMTESVTASCLTPRTIHKEGSIGIPYPDMYYKILKPGTQQSVPFGEDGEIVVSGPTVMKGYENNDEENAKTLQTHADGRVWLHTGDMGMMDEDGFVYFRQRIKRMIVSSGYNVYPSQLENVIDSHEKVLLSCVIGVPDDYKMQRIKAFIMLHEGQEATDEIKASILEHCEKSIAKFAMPSEIEYRKELPRTLIGKVAYLELEKEESDKLNKH